MNTAIIGCGQIADAHIQELGRLPGIKVTAVCDLNRHMAMQAAARFHVPNCYTDVGTMMKESRPDVVHITTPPASHLPISRTVLEFGSHIYMEKPFTTNYEQAEEIADIAREAGKLICVGHNNAFDPSYLRLVEKRDNGSLGEIVHLESVMGYNLTGPFGSIFMNDPNHWLHKLPGGLAQNNISHPLSLILGLMPDEKPEVRAFGYRWRTERYGDIRDEFFDEIRASFSGKRWTANLLFTSHARPMQLYITAYGTKKMACANLVSRTLNLVHGAEMPGPFAKIQWAKRDSTEAGREFLRHLWNLATARLHYFAGMKELFQRFYDSIEGKRDIPIPMSEILRETAVMDEIIHQCKMNDSNT